MTVWYGSKFEQTIHSKYLPEFESQPDCLHYVSYHVYRPDFIRSVNGYQYIIEAKGYLYSSEQARKYIDFRKTLHPNQELIFIFQVPQKIIKWKNKRKNGAKMSLCEWATKHKFRWFCENSLFLLVKEIRDRPDA